MTLAIQDAGHLFAPATIFNDTGAVQSRELRWALQVSEGNGVTEWRIGIGAYSKVNPLRVQRIVTTNIHDEIVTAGSWHLNMGKKETEEWNIIDRGATLYRAPTLKELLRLAKIYSQHYKPEYTATGIEVARDVTAVSWAILNASSRTKATAKAMELPLRAVWQVDSTVHNELYYLFFDPNMRGIHRLRAFNGGNANDFWVSHEDGTVFAHGRDIDCVAAHGVVVPEDARVTPAQFTIRNATVTFKAMPKTSKKINGSKGDL